MKELSIKSQNKRNSSIELLRIISMILIVLSHYTVHGQLQLSDSSNIFYKSFLYFTNTGNLGVDIFVIITGYFLINSKFKINKLVRLILQVLFYSVILFLFSVIITQSYLTPENLFYSLIPVTSQQYWFVTAYVVLYLIHPFINIVLSKLSKKDYLILLSVILIIWSIVPTILGFNFFGSEIPQFVMLYSIGAFFSRFELEKKIEKKLAIALICFSSLISIIVYLVYELFTHSIPILRAFPIDKISRTSTIIILLSVGIFLLFRNSNLGYKPFINSIAKCTFGVYLIHDNNYIRTLLWENWLPNGAYENSPYLIVHMVASVLIVYVVCTIIEYLRIHLIEAPLFKILDKPIEKFNKLIREKFNRLYNKFDKIFYKSQN